MPHLGGSFAQPLTDELIKFYGDLIGQLDHQSRQRAAIESLLAPSVQWWNLPESQGAAKFHGHGMVFRPLDDDIAKTLWDALPWDEELHEPGESRACVYGELFDAIAPELCRRDNETPADYAARQVKFTLAEAQALAVRNAGTHLLWHAKELGLRNREPVTVDKLIFAPSPNGPILSAVQVASLLGLVGTAGWFALTGQWGMLGFVPLGMALRLSAANRNARADAASARLNSGTMKIRTGAQETNVSDSDGGTLLSTVTFGSTMSPGASAGVATANSITSDTNAAASGTAGHARCYTSGAAIDQDLTCGQGSGDLSFDNSSIVAGGTVAISSFAITTPQ